MQFDPAGTQPDDDKQQRSHPHVFACNHQIIDVDANTSEIASDNKPLEANDRVLIEEGFSAPSVASSPDLESHHPEPKAETQTQAARKAEAKIELHYCPKELTKVALKTSVLVASVLSLPDAIAIIPQNQNLLSWSLAVLSLWLTALILWFVGFLGMMHLLRFSNGPLVCDENGVRGGRLDKVIPWDRIHAVSVETAPIFSKIFGLEPPAKKLSVFFGKSGNARLEHKDIASFFYTREDFEKLTSFLAERIIDAAPAPSSLFTIVRDGKLERMRGIFSLIKISRVLLSIVIAVSLVAFLGRKALTHYTYNQANIYFARAQYEYAKNEYANALSMDAAFPAGWHNLATCEYILGQHKDAIKHWKRALLLKPDMVEPKISLAQIAIEKRQFDKAETFLEPAGRHAPNNKAVMTKLAELLIAEGNEHRATKTARQIITAHEKDPYSICLLAKSKLRSGKAAAALKELQNIAEKDRGAFWQELQGECLLELGHADEALPILRKAYDQAPNNIDCMLSLANCSRAVGDYAASLQLIERVEKLQPNNPWVFLLRSKIEIDRHNLQAARAALLQAVDKSKQQDLNALELAGKLAKLLGEENLRKDLLHRSLQLSSHLDEKRSSNADFLIRELLFETE